MNYEHLTQEELIDLINAYDSYIMCAADAGMLVSGWTPVCIDEFYQHEYQEVWLQGGSFDYFYDEEELVIPTNAGSYRDANGTEIFRTASGDLMCRFDDEVKARPLRSHIQDIQPGDGFIVGALVRTASDAAHKNMDERDEPWIIYDDSGEGWFEEDIKNAEHFLRAVEHGKATAPEPGLLPVNIVTIVRERRSENEQWSDSFWVDAKEVPTVELFKSAVQDYLKTGDGHLAIKQTMEDFNWGDAMMYVPSYHWNSHGIYPVVPGISPKEAGITPTPNNNPIAFIVDQDEILIPDSYFEQKNAHRPLDDVISVAKERAEMNHVVELQPPER